MRVECPHCGNDFIISPRRRQRQSNLFHAACAEFASQTGQSLESVKVALKYAYGPWKEVTMRDDVPDYPGKLKWVYRGTFDEKLIWLKSESAYSVDEENALMRGLKAEAFDAGVELGDLLDE